MKVLFTTPSWVMNPNNYEELSPDMMSDYQFDTVFHGAREILGDGAVEVPGMLHMYKVFKELCPAQFKRVWGQGFTMYGNLSTDPVKTDSFWESVKCAVNGELEHFNGAVLGIHHSIAGNDGLITAAVNKLKQKIDPGNVIVIDGWDRQHITEEVAANTKYFKRELDSNPDIYPITFGIPEEKIIDVKAPYDKTFDFAPLIPVNHDIDASYRKTYIYDNEADYYKMYQNSFFGLTSKKGGWDTLRHYEIVANGCLPYFVDIENCPDQTLWNWPKNLLKKIKQMPGVYLNLKDGLPFDRTNHKSYLPNCSYLDMEAPGWIDWQEFDMKLYNQYRTELMGYLKRNLTTRAVAQRVLNHIWYK